jgi:hypothetical protein
MLAIRKEQMDALDLVCYRRQCIKFVGQELQIFDYDIPDKELQVLFEQFYFLLDIKNRNDRLTLVLLLLARLAFQNIFTQQAIARFMQESMTPENRRQRLQHALLQHVRYDAEFLHRKTWI